MSEPLKEAESRLDTVNAVVEMSEPRPRDRSARRVLRWIAIGQAATDAVVAASTLILARIVPLDGLAGRMSGPLVVGVWVVVFLAFGLYHSVTLPAWDEFRRVIAATTVAVLVVVVSTIWRRPVVPASALAASWLVALFLELCVRRGWRWVVWRLKCRGVLVLRTLIVGTNDDAVALAESLARTPAGYATIGHVIEADIQAAGRVVPLGSVRELSRLIVELSVDCVYVASPDVSGRSLFEVCRACRRANIEMRIAANLPQILPSRICVDSAGDLVAVAIQPARLTRFQSAVKRVFDVILATIALVVLSPVMAAIAIAILATSGRPVLFRQERVTKDLRRFRAYKFRTMVADADSSENHRRLQLATPFFKLPDDPRITPVGRVLRRLSLDELPQLWNVLRGQMSLVGPRPLRVEQVNENEQLLGTRHEVKAGLTGWWQIRGRSDVSGIEAVKMDTFYIENWSLALDVYILLKTIPTLLRARGAY